VHALGEGCLLYEIQQTSDTTFRVYDWDRMGWTDDRAAARGRVTRDHRFLPHWFRPATAGLAHRFRRRDRVALTGHLSLLAVEQFRVSAERRCAV